MKITFSSTQFPASGLLLVPVFDDGSLPVSFISKLTKEDKRQIEKAIQTSRITSQKDDYITLFSITQLKKATLCLWAAGAKKEFDTEIFGAKAIVSFRTSYYKSIHFYLADLDITEEQIACAAVGARMAAYRFDKHRSSNSGKHQTNITSVKLHVTQPAQARKCYQQFYAPVCDGQLLARDLINEPANVLHPKAYANRIKELEDCGLKVQILGEKKMKELNMHALVGVGQGSPRESQLVIMHWQGTQKTQTPICLVGKGITFDSGGISLKPANGMWNMKGDMGGSAAVVGAMHAIASRKAKVNVIGIVALAENMPDGNAQNPGDVITSMSGQTIELQSTDAEGRLVLADALWYAKEKFKPAVMVDLATLTGAKVVALGNEHAGLFTNEDQLANEFETSSIKAYERTWRLPLLPEYDQLLDSETADMKNSVSGGAGSITAAQFLQRFVGETPWVHLDIAGSSSKTERKDPREPSFATGYGVRLLNQWLTDNYER